MTVEIGTVAPDFTLPDADKRPISLSSFRGRRAVLIVFYPFAFSRICTAELGAIRDDPAAFCNERVQVLAVSTDPTFALKAWAAEQGFTFPLLSDFWPHGSVATVYGVFHEAAGMAVRGTFLVDTGGLVTFAEVNAPGEPRDQGGWKRAMAALR